ncbi:amino acid ABC transporter permease [Paenibacillus wynnii]|uniref:amino acid ABC transporter permease n=1 Tax=Paenibacillus wynnii TaxID=268407 RepID=UPI002791A64F|nr:amino acid ABC transporter permease [Paenibacillus wynnii]MDQ0194937.1 L-cystine transport system permease protein [Paenibacillus wynnii]
MRPFDPSFILEVFPQLLPYLSVTLYMLLGTVIFGSLLGFILARAKVRRRRVPKLLADIYIVALRCTPPIVLLFIVFYGLPELLMYILGVDINSFYRGLFVLVTFTLLFAASISEVMRTAYEAVDVGQREAAVSVGMSEFQAFYRIVLPQAVIVALPNFGNALINLMKDGSLAYTIGLIDIMGQGTLIISRNYGSYALETYIALAVIYLSITILIEKSLGALEKHLSKGKRGIAVRRRNIWI